MSTQTKVSHTSGEWTIYEGPDRAIRIERGPRGICKLPYYLDDENKANAYLIAAAPDLLEACELVLYAPQPIGWYIDKSRLDKIEAAVRKAKGETA